MIKVLSGEFKGRKLNKINLDSIRPTQAKVKKSKLCYLVNPKYLISYLTNFHIL